MVSSEEKFGTEDIDRRKIVGIDRSEGSRILLEDCKGIVGTEACRVVVDVEDCRVGGSRMESCSKTIVDVLRMYDPLKLHPQTLLHSHIVEQIAQFDHSVKADLCRATEHVDADNHKRVRFDVNVDNNNDNDKQQHNDEGQCVWNNGVGVCKSIF